MKKRKFIKTGLLGLIGLSSIRLHGNGVNKSLFGAHFSIPELSYTPASIRAFISEQSFVKHYNTHYKSFNKSLNYELKNVVFAPDNVKHILLHPGQYSNSIVNNACGYYNHKMFWKSLSPKGGGAPKGELAKSIKKDFDTYENLKQSIEKKAKLVKESGWVWLIWQNNTLKVISTNANDNPLLPCLSADKQGFPILGIDLWKHAYTNDFGNNISAYLNNYWKIVNWKYITTRLNRAQKS